MPTPTAPQTTPATPPPISAPDLRSEAVPSAANPQPVSQTEGPYGADGVLREDWVEHLSLTPFDEIAFFREYDIVVADATSFTQRLDAAYRCFRPAMTDRQAPLDLDDMHQPRLRRFFRQLIVATGLDDELPPDRLAPHFKQHLFQRWFLALASPPSADGNGGPDAFPLKDLFLSATYAKPALVRACDDGPDRPHPMRIDYLHDNIAAQFRRENPGLDTKAREWILAALLSIFEPTLLRPDPPPNSRYGTLEWTLLDMGLRMAGPQAQRYSHRELVGLAAATDIVADDGDGDGNGGPGLASRYAGSVLRMAHAQGVIDLRDGEADVATLLETAIPLFQRELEELRQSASIETLLGAMPTRGSIVAAALRKRGLDPEKSYHLKRGPVYQRGLLASQTKAAPGLAFNTPHTLSDFVMADCVRQLYQFGGLGRRQLGTLERSLKGLTHAGLNTTFRSIFDAAFHAFSDNVLARLLTGKIGALDSSDSRFWQCGRAIVSRPKVRIATRIAPRPDLGATGVGRKITSRIAEYTASRGVLVALTLEDSGGAPETRHYWVTQKLGVGRFDGDVAAFLYERDRLNDFFEPKNKGELLWALDLQSHPHAEIMQNDAALTVAQLVARQLVAPQMPTLRDRAFQMTGPEARLDQIAESLLDLLPFRACAKALADARFYDGALSCMADGLALIPAVRAGRLVVRNAAAVVAVQTRPQLKRLAQSLARGFAGRNLSYAAMRNILYVGRPALLTVKAAARFFNPLDPLWSGFVWIRGYRAALGAQLLQKLGKISLFRSLVRDIERDVALPCVFEKGFWRAAPGAAVTRENGLRQLRIGDRNYFLKEVGGQRDVLALSEGGRHYLADPRTGGLLAPLSRPRAGMRYNPRQAIAQRAVCRAKRSATVSEDACANLIMPAAKFGSGYFRTASEKTFEGVQMRVRQLSGDRKAYLQTRVNLNDLGFKSAAEAGDGPRNRYFAFDAKVWIAENGRLRETAIVCPYPERIEATVIRLDAPGNAYGRADESALEAGGGDYLQFEIKLPKIPGEPEPIYQTFIAPYGSYPGPDGTHRLMVDFPDASFYGKGSWNSELKPGQKVLLKRVQANMPDSKLFEQYRQINLNVRSQPDPFQSGSLYQLRDARGDMQQRFGEVYKGAEKMLVNALKSLKNPPRDFDRLMDNLLPQRWTRRKRREFLEKMENNLENMIAAARIVERNKYEVIGFGRATRSFTDMGTLQLMLPYVRAEGLSGSMVGEMKHFPLIGSPLMVFDEDHFKTSHLVVLGGDFTHELSHLCVPPAGTSDAMSAQSMQAVYPHQSVFAQDELNIRPLRDAWAQPDSDPAMHASTNEIMVLLLSALMDPARKGTLDGIMAGGSTFRLRPDTPVAACKGNCALLR